MFVDPTIPYDEFAAREERRMKAQREAEYPECEKLGELSVERQAISEFLEYLSANGIRLCRSTDEHPRWYPISTSDDALFMQCYGIDENKLEAERRAMLENFRNSG